MITIDNDGPKVSNSLNDRGEGQAKPYRHYVYDASCG